MIIRNSKEFELTETGYELYEILKSVFGILEKNFEFTKNDNLYQELSIGVRHFLSDFIFKNALIEFVNNIPHIEINTEKMNELEVASLVLNAIKLWRIDDDNRKFIMDLFSIDNLQSSNNLTYQELSEKMLKKVKVKKLERRKKL